MCFNTSCLQFWWNVNYWDCNPFMGLGCSVFAVFGVFFTAFAWVGCIVTMFACCTIMLFDELAKVTCLSYIHIIQLFAQLRLIRAYTQWSWVSLFCVDHFCISCNRLSLVIVPTSLYHGVPFYVARESPSEGWWWVTNKGKCMQCCRWTRL